MEVLGGFIILISFGAFILGVVNVIRPQSWMKVRKRLVGLFIILGSMGGCVAGATMVPPAPATTPMKGEAKTVAPEPAVVKATGLTQAEFTGVWSDVKARMERCDGPTRRAAEVLSQGDVYAAFGPTKAAAAACEDVWLKMSNVPLPRAAKGEVRKAMSEAIDTCETAMFAKREALQSLLKALDGDQRPSTMETITSEMERGKAATMMCGIGFLSAAEKAGLVLPEMEEAMKEAEAG